MSWRRWFATDTGRNFLQISAFAASFSAFAAVHLPQSFLLDKYKETVQSYQLGLGQPVSAKAKQLYEEVLKDLQVPKHEQALLNIFTVYGFDLFHAGSTVLRTGAIIGIPVNFGYQTEKDVDRKIKVVTKSVDWESQAGEMLKKSLVLSEDARRFALAREVTSASSPSVWLYSFYPSSAILIAYTMSRTLNRRFQLRNHPFRFIMYSLVSLFSFSLYCTLNDITTVMDESSSDETAAKISPVYAQGGVEFYSKLRDRNKALRELMGSVGEKVYTVSGNDIVFLRMKTTPLSERLHAVEEIVSSFKAEPREKDEVK